MSLSLRKHYLLPKVVKLRIRGDYIGRKVDGNFQVLRDGSVTGEARSDELEPSVVGAALIAKKPNI